MPGHVIPTLMFKASPCKCNCKSSPCHFHHHYHHYNVTISMSSGPGVPSGHSQAAAVILWCLTDVLRASARPLSLSSLGLWAVFIAGQVNTRLFFGNKLFNGLTQVLMWVSRLYISAHFPHQCLMGFVVGLITVRCDIFILES